MKSDQYYFVILFPIPIMAYYLLLRKKPPIHQLTLRIILKSFNFRDLSQLTLAFLFNIHNQLFQKILLASLLQRIHLLQNNNFKSFIISVIVLLHPRKFSIHLLFNSLLFNFIFLSYNSLIIMLTFLFKLSFCNFNWVAQSNLFLVQYIDCLRNTLNLLKADDSIAFNFVFFVFVETNLLLGGGRIKTNYTAWCDELLYFFHRNIIRKAAEIYA